MEQPVADRPVMPDGYGIPQSGDGLLDWGSVEGRLRDAEVYWMASTRPDGRPHVVPRWGVWMNGHLYYDGAPTTRHARNLVDNPRCALHLEDGTRAVILEGESGPTSPPGLELGTRLSADFRRKYADAGYTPPPDAWEGEAAGGLCRFTPVTGLAWTTFPTDATRYRFTPPARVAR